MGVSVGQFPNSSILIMSRLERSAIISLTIRPTLDNYSIVPEKPPLFPLNGGRNMAERVMVGLVRVIMVPSLDSNLQSGDANGPFC